MHYNNQYQSNQTQIIMSKKYDQGFKKQDDSELVEYIKQHWIDPPSSQLYNITKTTKKNLIRAHSKIGFYDRLFQNKTGGFFVECGAHDGQMSSNSLEMFRKFNGILIEANPESYRMLKTVHRKGHSIGVCLSPYNHTKWITY